MSDDAGNLVGIVTDVSATIFAAKSQTDRAGNTHSKFNHDKNPVVVSRMYSPTMLCRNNGKPPSQISMVPV